MARNSIIYDTSPLAGLLGRAPVSLLDWYGDPLEPDMANALLAEVRTRQSSRLRAGACCFQLQVLAMICHEGLGTAYEPGYEQLAVLAADNHARALLELVQGQLLAGRKRTGAMDHLQQGFCLAAPLLVADQYFELVRRHESLGCLSFQEKPSVVQDLESLLNEAGVVHRLRKGERHLFAAGHRDTIG